MKKILIMMSMIFSVLLLAGSVIGLGSVTLQTPAASATLTGTAEVVNISFTNTELETISCQLQAISSGTANSTAFDLFNLTNVTSGADTSVNTTYDFSTLEDASTYTLTARCENSTTAATDTSTSVVVDYTVPTGVNTTTLANAVLAAETISYNVGGSTTTACTIFFDGIGRTATHSGSTCTYAITASNTADKAYVIYMQATDGLNTTNSANLNIQVQTNSKNRNILPTSSLADISTEDLGKVKGSGTNTVVIAVVLLGALYFMNNKKLF